MNVKVKIESESERVGEKILLTYVQLCETGSVAKLCLALLQLSFELVKIRRKIRIFSTCIKRRDFISSSCSRKRISLSSTQFFLILFGGGNTFRVFSIMAVSQRRRTRYIWKRNISIKYCYNVHILV